MPTTVLDDCEIHYELIGEGSTVVLTPGGRLGGAAVRATADMLAERHRVLLWDRRNTGSSSVWFGAEPEQLVWADDLAVLLRRLELAPAYLVGASAGSRVSYLTALRHPDVAAGLVLWSVSGGPYASQNLGYEYHVPFIIEARRGGMDGVAATPFFRERIEANPVNRSRLLSTPPEQFIAALQAWNASFFHRHDTPVIAATGDDLRAIRCPTLVFAGNDDLHPPEAALAVHQLIKGSQLAPLPWSHQEWIDHLVGRVSGPVMDLYPRLVPAVLDFLAQAEAGRADGWPRPHGSS
jgi:pimeloyl-ACP methyl ester carboxylesterase